VVVVVVGSSSIWGGRGKVVVVVVVAAAFGITERFAGSSCDTKHNLRGVYGAFMLVFTKTVVCYVTRCTVIRRYQPFWRHLLSWMPRQNVPSKRRYLSTKTHGVTSKKITLHNHNHENVPHDCLLIDLKLCVWQRLDCFLLHSSSSTITVCLFLQRGA
jgi:hypothetical protein